MYQEERSPDDDLGQSDIPRPISCCWKSARRNRLSRFGIAAFLIMIGLFWLAATAGWFPVEYIGPIVLTAFGLWMLAHVTFCGIAMTVMGALWLAETAGHFHHAYFWPLLLITMGILMFAAHLIKRRNTA